FVPTIALGPVEYVKVAVWGEPVRLTRPIKENQFIPRITSGNTNDVAAEAIGDAGRAAQSERLEIFSSDASEEFRAKPRTTSNPTMLTIGEKMFCGIELATT